MFNCKNDEKSFENGENNACQDLQSTYDTTEDFHNITTEETFRILFNVMERHFVALSLPDPANDPKITRAISFTELSSTRKILFEQYCRIDDSDSLIRQYSCEQIFYKHTGSRKEEFSRFAWNRSERSLCPSWRAELPTFGASGEMAWHKNPKKVNFPQKMEPMETDAEIFPIWQQKNRGNSDKRPPIVELNGMSLSDSDDRPLVKSSTFANLHMDSDNRSLVKSSTFTNSPVENLNVFAKPTARSRSVSPRREIIAESKLALTPQAKRVENPNKICLKRLLPRAIELGEEIKSENMEIPESQSGSNAIETKSADKSAILCCRYFFFFLLSLMILILAITLHEENSSANSSANKLLNNNFDYNNLRAELRQRIYGQNREIDELMEDLRTRSTGTNVVILIGGTGVGKSLAVRIVRKYFFSRHHVFEYFSPLGNSLSSVFPSLWQRACNLIILENLQKADLLEVADFAKFAREKMDKFCVYAIAIYNPRGEELVETFDLDKSVREVSRLFQGENLKDAKLIAFQRLDEKSIEKCIKRAADDKNVTLSAEKLREIRDDLIVTDSGCKGAYAKVQLLIEM